MLGQAFLFDFHMSSLLGILVVKPVNLNIEKGQKFWQTNIEVELAGIEDWSKLHQVSALRIFFFFHFMTLYES